MRTLSTFSRAERDAYMLSLSEQDTARQQYYINLGKHRTAPHREIDRLRTRLDVTTVLLMFASTGLFISIL